MAVNIGVFSLKKHTRLLDTDKANIILRDQMRQMIYARINSIKSLILVEREESFASLPAIALQNMDLLLKMTRNLNDGGDIEPLMIINQFYMSMEDLLRHSIVRKKIHENEMEIGEIKEHLGLQIWWIDVISALTGGPMITLQNTTQITLGSMYLINSVITLCSLFLLLSKCCKKKFTSCKQYLCCCECDKHIEVSTRSERAKLQQSEL